MAGSYPKPILQLFQNPVFPLGDALLRHAEYEGKLIVGLVLVIFQVEQLLVLCMERADNRRQDFVFHVFIQLVPIENRNINFYVGFGAQVDFLHFLQGDAPDEMLVLGAEISP